MLSETIRQSFLASAAELGVEELHFRIDPGSGLYAIIAIHSTRRGPALGGCRCLGYASVDDAIADALRLARGMSYKAAICRLPLGGGKAVLMRPQTIADRRAYFETLGTFIDQLGGRYITAVDSGTDVADMDLIARRTVHVSSTSVASGGVGDPSASTALGVCRGIEAAAHWRLGRTDLEDLDIAIQGVGKVGHLLAGLLHQRGARLMVSDRDAIAAERCRDEFNASILSPESIYGAEADIFAPCALGGTLNRETIPRLRAPIVAGSANNQLAEARDGDRLYRAGILYAPDYVINAGGLMHVALADQASIHEKVLTIYDLLAEIFQKSAHQQKPPEVGWLRL